MSFKTEPPSILADFSIVLFFVLFSATFTCSGLSWEKENNNSLLLTATDFKDTQKVEDPIGRGVDLNSESEEGTLHEAARSTGRKTVELLIAETTDVNTHSKASEYSLCFNVAMGFQHQIKFLISKGADINARDEQGQTPLFCAVRKDIVELLVSKGADVNIKDNYGKTPLHDAVGQVNDTYRIVEYLISAGADINAKTDAIWKSRSMYGGEFPEGFPEGSTPPRFRQNISER